MAQVNATRSLRHSRERGAIPAALTTTRWDQTLDLFQTLPGEAVAIPSTQVPGRTHRAVRWHGSHMHMTEKWQRPYRLLGRLCRTQVHVLERSSPEPACPGTGDGRFGGATLAAKLCPGLPFPTRGGVSKGVANKQSTRLSKSSSRTTCA